MANQYLINTITKNGLSSIELSRLAGWSDGMVNNLMRWNKRVTPEQAVKLELISNGLISAEKLSPDFFKKLNNIGYKKTNSKLEKILNNNEVNA